MPLADAFLGGFNAMENRAGRLGDERYRMADLAFRERAAEDDNNLRMALQRLMGSQQLEQIGARGSQDRITGREEFGYNTKLTEQGIEGDLRGIGLRGYFEDRLQGKRLTHDSTERGLDRTLTDNMSIRDDGTRRYLGDLNYRADIYGTDSRASTARQALEASTMVDEFGNRVLPAVAAGMREIESSNWESDFGRQTAEAAARLQQASQGGDFLAGEVASRELERVFYGHPDQPSFFNMAPLQRQQFLETHGESINDSIKRMEKSPHSSLRNRAKRIAAMISGEVGSNFEDLLGSGSRAVAADYIWNPNVNLITAPEQRQHLNNVLGYQGPFRTGYR